MSDGAVRCKITKNAALGQPYCLCCIEGRFGGEAGVVCNLLVCSGMDVCFEKNEKKARKNLVDSTKGRNFASLLKTKPPAQRSVNEGEVPDKRFFGV